MNLYGVILNFFLFSFSFYPYTVIQEKHDSIIVSIISVVMVKLSSCFFSLIVDKNIEKL